MLVELQVSQELEKYQGPIKLDDKNPYHGTQRRLTYDLQDKIGYKNQTTKLLR